jgi:hypothetical protein
MQMTISFALLLPLGALLARGKASCLFHTDPFATRWLFFAHMAFQVGFVGFTELHSNPQLAHQL